MTAGLITRRSFFSPEQHDNEDKISNFDSSGLNENGSLLLCMTETEKRLLTRNEGGFK